MKWNLVQPVDVQHATVDKLHATGVNRPRATCMTQVRVHSRRNFLRVVISLC